MSRTISHLVALVVTRPSGFLQLYSSWVPVGQLLAVNGTSHVVKLSMPDPPVGESVVRGGRPRPA